MKKIKNLHVYFLFKNIKRMKNVKKFTQRGICLLTSLTYYILC